MTRIHTQKNKDHAACDICGKSPHLESRGTLRVFVWLRQMQTVGASLLVGSEQQEIRLRLTEDTLYVDRQLALSHSSTNLPARDNAADSAKVCYHARA